MERMTQWFGNGTCRVAGMAAEHEEMHTTDEIIDLLLDKLATYEDTGLTPEQIDRVLMANAKYEQLVTEMVDVLRNTAGAIAKKLPDMLATAKEIEEVQVWID